MGLTLCVVAGADLFTSNCMYATIAVWEGARAGGSGVHPSGFAPFALRVFPGQACFCVGQCGGPRCSPSPRPLNSPPGCSASPCAALAGRYGLLGLLRCWLVSYFSNLLGSLMLVRPRLQPSREGGCSAGTARPAMGRCRCRSVAALRLPRAHPSLPALLLRYTVPQMGLMMGGDVFYGTRKDFVIE